MVREIRGMMLAALIMLPGCTDGAEASPQQDQESSVSTQDDGTVEIFEYGALSVEVTGVEEKRLGSTFDGQETWKYDIYVVRPGATVEILNAGTFLDSETGAPYANCARFPSFLGERNDRLTNTKRYGLFHCHWQVPVVGGIPVALIRLTCPGAMSSGAGNLRSVRQDQRYIRPQPVPGELRLTYQFDPCRCNSDLFKLYGVLAI